MARKSEMEFPTEWVIYETDDDKRSYEEHSEDYARDAASDQAEPAVAAHADGSEDTRRAGLKVMRAAG